MKFRQKFLINAITIFPQAFEGLLDISIIGSARKKGIWDLQITDIKDLWIKVIILMINHMVVVQE